MAVLDETSDRILVTPDMQGKWLRVVVRAKSPETGAQSLPASSPYTPAIAPSDAAVLQLRASPVAGVDANPAAFDLNGATITEPVNVYLDIIGAPAKVISRVEWDVDEGVSGRTDDLNAPYQLLYSGALAPLDYWRTPGNHVVTALVVYTDSTAEQVVASFTVPDVGTVAQPGGAFTPTAATRWYMRTTDGLDLQRVATDRIAVVGTVGDGAFPGFPGLTLRMIYESNVAGQSPAYDYVAGGPRVELRNGDGAAVGVPEGREFYAGWWTYLWPDFPPSNPWVVAGQWHILGGASPTPMLEFTKTGKLQVARRWGESQDGTKAEFREVYPSIPRGVPFFQWWHIVASKGDGGLIEHRTAVGSEALGAPVAIPGPNRYTTHNGAAVSNTVAGSMKLGRYGPAHSPAVRARLNYGGLIVSDSSAEVLAVHAEYRAKL